MIRRPRRSPLFPCTTLFRSGHVAAEIGRMIGAADGVAVGATARSDHIGVMADRDRSAATIGSSDQAVIGLQPETRAGNRHSRRERRDDRAGLVIDRDELALA